MADLLNVDVALDRVLQSIATLSTETLPLSEAFGRVLAEPIISDVNLPPFPASTMDGFALLAEDTQYVSPSQPATLRVVMDIPAGHYPERRLHAGQAARIMTGAPIPDGANAVIPVEQTDAQWVKGESTPPPESIRVFRAMSPGAYIYRQGEDVSIGQTVMVPGHLLRAAEIGVLAGLGHAQVVVQRQPRVALISTGDELVDLDEPLTPGKIRDSNSYTLTALIHSYGGIPIRIPTARDTLEDVRRCFRQALDSHLDLMLSSAGVSVGAFDVVQEVLREYGQVDFWRINLRPGKPLAFGHVGGIPFFGLPGNPVSAMVTFDVFVRPALLKMGGRPYHTPTIQAAAGEDIRSDGRRSYLRVRLTREDQQWVARLTGTQTSGALTSMLLADGLMIVPEEVQHVAAGTVLPVRLLRDLPNG